MSENVTIPPELCFSTKLRGLEGGECSDEKQQALSSEHEQRGTILKVSLQREFLNYKTAFAPLKTYGLSSHNSTHFGIQSGVKRISFTF